MQFSRDQQSKAPDAGNAAAEGNGLTGSWADGPHPHGLPTGRGASRPAVDQRVAFEAQGAPCGSAHRCLPGGRQGTTRLFIGRLFQGLALDIVAREANVDIKLGMPRSPLAPRVSGCRSHKNRRDEHSCALWAKLSDHVPTPPSGSTFSGHWAVLEPFSQ